MVEAKTIRIAEDDLKGSAKFDLEPGDYEGKILSVKDHVSATGNEGWVWEIEVKGVTFKMWTMFTQSSKWKMIEVMKALKIDVAEGDIAFNPNDYIGAYVGVELDKEEDSEYLNISRTFPTVGATKQTEGEVPF
jgi:hypothetical protein